MLLNAKIVRELKEKFKIMEYWL